MDEFNKQTIRDIDVHGKTILVHAELDAPLDQKTHSVTSNFRINASLPTIEYLKKEDCKIILISKLGRPAGKVDPGLSLRPVAETLSKLLGQEVGFVSDCVGPEVKKAAQLMKGGDVLVLENLRFHPEEKANDKNFAKKIATDTGAEVFVADCFA
ncbi:MAG: phosphoglycerate kinase, partial [Candidatus Saccharimonadales bacterium]